MIKNYKLHIVSKPFKEWEADILKGLLSMTCKYIYLMFNILHT